MIEFDFQVCNSFLGYPTQPITIPTRYNGDVEAHKLGPGFVTVIGPEGQSYPGQIYRGYSSWGLYY